jgi:hypothetical protein
MRWMGNAAILLLAACSPTGAADLASQSPSHPAAPQTTAPPAATSVQQTVPEPQRADPQDRSAGTAPSDRIDGRYLVSVTAVLPDGFAEGIARLPGVIASVVLVGNVSVVESHRADGTSIDRAPEGFVIPVELQQVEPNAHGHFVPDDVAEMLAGLKNDEILLSTASARLRRMGVGDDLLLDDGTVLRVAGIVDGEWIGAAEIVSTRPGPFPDTHERYVVVDYAGSRAVLERRLAGLTDEAVRVLSSAEVPIFRHADAVLPQIAVKEQYGEFAYRPRGRDRIEIDPAWVEANIVSISVPLLGQITCHREFAEQLRTVMTRLEATGSGDVIDRGAYLGCWNPRFVRDRRDLSRHAWGVAADINFGNDLAATESPIAPPLLHAMGSAGIRSGHTWTNPGPGHFEWYGTTPR